MVWHKAFPLKPFWLVNVLLSQIGGLGFLAHPWLCSSQASFDHHNLCHYSSYSSFTVLRIQTSWFICNYKCTLSLEDPTLNILAWSWDASSLSFQMFRLMTGLRACSVKEIEGYELSARQPSHLTSQQTWLEAPAWLRNLVARWFFMDPTTIYHHLTLSSLWYTMIGSASAKIGAILRLQDNTNSSVLPFCR